jgi:hypothetical protein
VPALYPAGRVCDRLPHNHPSLLITPSQPHQCTESRKTPEQRRDELADERVALAGQEAKVLEVATWLRGNVTPIKTPTVGSYRMKHVVERAISKYVTNGELIAAALIAGYRFKYTAGPNMLFGMSTRDVKRIDSARLSTR